MKSARHLAVLCCGLVALVAHADYCGDIKAQCGKNFELDIKACGNPNDRQGQQCVANAHRRLADCVKTSGCK
jgi:hypothetical protein